MKIRRADARDAEPIVVLYLQLKEHHSQLAPGMPRYDSADESWRHFAESELARSDRWFYIAYSGEVIVGFVKLMFEEKVWGISCEIETLIVDENARGGGVGLALMRRAEEVAREQGALGMRVNVLPTNGDGRTFYEGDGYRPMAVRYGKSL